MANAATAPVAAAAAAAPAPAPTTPRFSYLSPNIQALVEKYRAKKSGVGSILSTLFTASIAAFVIFIVLLLIHFLAYPIFKFTPDEPGILEFSSDSDKIVAFKDDVAGSNEAVPLNNTAIPTAGFTLGFDAFLPRQMISTTAPRILLYRSTKGKLTVAPATAATAAAETALKGFVTDSATIMSNFLVWLDPMKNDLFVTVMTKDSAGALVAHTTPAISNLPIEAPFRVTVTIAPSFTEVYVNGKLFQTLAYGTPLVSMPANSLLFAAAPPTSGSSLSSALMSSVTYWPRVLSPREIQSSEKVTSAPSLYRKTL